MAGVLKEKEWNRGKLMLTGGGRAGKTALGNTIVGHPFEETDSTIGIEETKLNVTFAAIGSEQSGNWKKVKVGQDCELREYELALAIAILDTKVGYIYTSQNIRVFDAVNR
jgi:GTPase SAR1 family protein